MRTVGLARWIFCFLSIVAALGALWAVDRARSRSDSIEGAAADSRSPAVASAEQALEASGLIVDRLSPDGQAARSGIRVGDRVSTVNGERVSTPAALLAAIENGPVDDELALGLKQGSETTIVRLPRRGLRIETRPELSERVERAYDEGLRAWRDGDLEGAERSWSMAIESAGSAGADLAAAWLRIRLAQLHESRQRWVDAADSYRRALEHWEPGVEDASRSRVLFALSKCYQQSADAISARRCLEEARRLDAAAGRFVWESADLHTLGTLTWARGEFDSALGFFSGAVALRERWMPGSTQLGESLNGMGAVAYQQGELDKAEDYYRRSLQICESAMPESLAVADGLNNLGVVAMGRGLLDAAHDYHSRSLALRERLAPDSEAVTAALSNMGIVEYRRGHLQAAQDYYGRSLEIHERLGSDPLYVARDFINLGVIAYERGDLDAAQDHYSRGLALLERVAPDSPDCMASVYNLGMVAADRGDWELAQTNLTRALAFRERTAPDSLAVAESCNALGNLAFARLDLDTAESYYTRALRIEERHAPDSLLISVNVHNLGGVALRRGQLDAAKGFYQRALALRERMAPGSLDLASSLHGLGDIALRQGRPQEALPLLVRAIETIEAQRDHIHGIRSRAFLLARYSEPYVTLQRAYLELGDLPAAFATIERARARSLLDGLGEARADIREGVEPTLLAREREVAERLSATELQRQASLVGAVDASRAAAIESTLNEILVEYEEIQGQIRRASPRYAALTQPQPSTLKEIQEQVLDADTVLLEYALGREISHLWLVGSDEIRTFELPGQEEVDRLARRVHELLTVRNRARSDVGAEISSETISRADLEYRETASVLSRMVLGPAAAHLGEKRLLIVADGALHYVPFGALPVPDVETSDAESSTAEDDHPAAAIVAEFRPLIVDHEVISLPSASTLAVLRRELAGREPAPSSVAVLADPVLEPNDPRVLARRDDSPPGSNEAGDGDSTTKDRVRGVTRIRPTVVQRLRFSREEAENILALAAEPELAALDFHANKRIATGPELGRYRIVHLATHGLLDSQHPELSGIVLSLVDETGAAQDGFLRLHEIYNLRLNADLVVLSACQTALGREVRGEGLVGLTRGFMYAGAERVVASLWSVQDQATSEWMKTFYEAMLRDGRSPAAALRTAQVAMWREGREPYYWAAFVLQGEFE